MAEPAAFEMALIEHLNATHPATDPNYCAHCGQGGEVLLPIGTTRHAWLHQGCWEPWRAVRRAKAIAELAGAAL